MTEISGILAIMGIAIITMSGLTFVAYSIFSQRYMAHRKGLGWKILKEEKWIGGTNGFYGGFGGWLCCL